MQIHIRKLEDFRKADRDYQERLEAEVDRLKKKMNLKNQPTTPKQ